MAGNVTPGKEAWMAAGREMLDEARHRAKALECRTGRYVFMYT